MCGIAGFIGAGDHDDLSRMIQAVAHRGPNGDGREVFPDDGVHLGHSRLSIIDIDGGHQPMCNETRTVWVTFNGEIYNHRALRKDLEANGHTFKSDHSDTEVLVHGWEEWGEGLAAKLNGMFAFAIWDDKRKSLYLARDRFGEKPLFWGQTEGAFLFASELSAFRGHRTFKPELDAMSLKKFFAHGFIPAPNAVFKGTHKLKPGHWLKLSPGQSPEISAYWRFHIEPANNPPSLEEAAEEIRARLLASVERRLMSDVPLGVFLSGGVDSSAAAAAMCTFRDPYDVKSFCIGFTEPSYDESGYARSMAETLGCTHKEEILNFEHASEWTHEILAKMDEPIADSSLLPTFMLCRLAKKHVDVALSGDGGDELFAGYDTFKALKTAGLYHALVPRPVHKGMRRLADMMPKSDANMSLDFKVRRALQGLEYGPELWNPAWIAPLEVDDIKDIFNEPVEVEELYSEVLSQWHRSSDLSVIDKTLEFYSNFYLPDAILTKVDRAAMFNGLEARSVFLDTDLVDFVRTLPAEYKFDGTTRKLVLKKALNGLVPDSVLARKKKGFSIPLKTWLGDLQLSPKGSKAAGLEEQEILKRIATHQHGGQDHRLFLWAWTALQHFSGRLVETP